MSLLAPLAVLLIINGPQLYYYNYSFFLIHSFIYLSYYYFWLWKIAGLKKSGFKILISARNNTHTYLKDQIQNNPNFRLEHWVPQKAVWLIIIIPLIIYWLLIIRWCNIRQWSCFSLIVVMGLLMSLSISPRLFFLYFHYFDFIASFIITLLTFIQPLIGMPFFFDQSDMASRFIVLLNFAK